MQQDALDNKDEPLRNDIRLLGRILGDTVREQEGDTVFELVERVRQTAVRFARDGDPAARNELAALLDPLPRDTTQAVVRAFSYFLQLANIAEDEHHIRRRRAHDLAGSPPREGSLIHALDALAQADVAVAMNSGTQAAKEAGNMVDLDSNPTKLIEVVETGKQMLMTRGALTTFSIANDVAKYFAIIPAAFVGTYPQLASLNVMQLHSADSAILSAVIFNALIIIALVPLALRGVPYRAVGAAVLLRRNLLIYGLGGLIVPFVAIKIIDVLLTVFGWV